MTYEIFLQNQHGDYYTATTIGFPSLQVEGKSRSEALDNMRVAIRNYLQNGEIVKMDISDEIMASEHPTLGMFENDPYYDEFLAEVEAYRAEHNKIEY